MVKQIALIGASSDPHKYGNIVLRDLVAKGFAVTPVNPRGGIIENLPVCPRIADLSPTIELLVFVVPPEIGLIEAREAVRCGFRSLWFQPGAGSAEIGAIFEQQEGVMLVMNRCIMVETGS